MIHFSLDLITFRNIFERKKKWKDPVSIIYFKFFQFFIFQAENLSSF